MIDKRVTEYNKDFPYNDAYSINLINNEYPYKDLDVDNFTIEQANQFLDEAIAKALNALKDAVPVWRDIKQ
uniref:Uncharacterized protein n=1 Tax=Ditylenchus dipsaci TaxID=166011 RepID=A0A915CUY4_9BILA